MSTFARSRRAKSPLHWRPELTRQERAAFLFVLPLLILLTVFWIIPSLSSLFYSLTNYSVVSTTRWVGIDN